MLDYYGILQIPTDAEPEQIKKSFRKRAKEIHPDLWNQEQNAIDSMRDLLKAYETLMDPYLREEYDVKHRMVYSRGGFDYREFLLARQDDLESQSKLIFFDLLHNRESDALRLYEQLVRNKKLDLSTHLDREDFMDCAFILAEEFEANQQFESAFYLLKTITEYELQRPYFKHFFEEVIQRLHTLVGSKMFGVVPIDTHFTFAQQLIEFNIHPKETAFYFRVCAELCIKLKDFSRAERYIQESLKLDKQVPGVKKLRQLILKGKTG
jgi:curved DNA-binding protein CbpA